VFSNPVQSEADSGKRTRSRFFAKALICLQHLRAPPGGTGFSAPLVQISMAEQRIPVDGAKWRVSGVDSMLNDVQLPIAKPGIFYAVHLFTCRPRTKSRNDGAGQ